MKHILVAIFLFFLIIPITKSQTSSNVDFTDNYNLSFKDDKFHIKDIIIEPRISVERETDLSSYDYDFQIQDMKDYYKFGINIKSIVYPKYIAFNVYNVSLLDDYSYTDGKIRIDFSDLYGKGILILNKNKAILYYPTTLNLDPIIELKGNSTNKYYYKWSGTGTTPSSAITEFTSSYYGFLNTSDDSRLNLPCTPSGTCSGFTICFELNRFECFRCGCDYDFLSGICSGTATACSSHGTQSNCETCDCDWSAGGNPRYSHWRFTYNLTGLGVIDNVTYAFEGYNWTIDPIDDGLAIYWKNQSDSTWIKDVELTNTETTYTKGNTTNISDWVNPTTNILEFGITAKCEISGGAMYGDFANLTVGYHTTTTTTTTSTTTTTTILETTIPLAIPIEDDRVWLFSVLDSLASKSVNVTDLNLQITDTENLEDTYITESAGLQSTNFGSDNFIKTVNGTFEEYSLIKFNITDLPDDVTIDSAILRVYMSSNLLDPTEAFNTSVHHLLNQTWEEQYPTWTNKAELGYHDPERYDTISFNSDSPNGFYNFTVTDIIRNASESNYENVTFYLISYEPDNSPSGIDDIAFISKDYAILPLIHPMLNITYSNEITEQMIESDFIKLVLSDLKDYIPCFNSLENMNKLLRLELCIS